MTPWGRAPPGGEGGEAAGVLRTLAADELSPPPAPPLGNGPKTGGDDSEHPYKVASSIPGTKTPLAAHLASKEAVVMDFLVRQPATATQDWPEAATGA